MNDLASTKLLLSEQDSKLIGEKSLSLIKKKERPKKRSTKESTLRKQNNKTDQQPKPLQVSKDKYKNIEKDEIVATRRIIPDAAFQVEQERNLRKIATRGVVLLFNQVAQKQATGSTT